MDFNPSLPPPKEALIEVIPSDIIITPEMDANYIQNLHNLLAQTSVPDTAVVKNATDALQKQYYKSPQCLPALFQVISTSQDLNVRQLAAVELRKEVTKKSGAMWKKQAQQVRSEIKSQILQGVLAEQSVLVRNAVSRVISQPIAQRLLTITPTI